MKRISYTITYQDQHGADTTTEAVYARSINSGFGKALAQFLRSAPKTWELCSIEFEQVH